MTIIDCRCPHDIGVLQAATYDLFHRIGSWFEEQQDHTHDLHAQVDRAQTRARGSSLEAAELTARLVQIQGMCLGFLRDLSDPASDDAAVSLVRGVLAVAQGCGVDE